MEFVAWFTHKYVMHGFLWSVHDPYPIAIGAGITMYGLTYFIIHDIVIHQRLPILKNPGNFYISAIVKAHGLHHWGKNTKNFKCYGLLIFPKRFLK